MRIVRCLWAVALAAIVLPLRAQEPYRLPPPEVVQILDAPQAPYVSVSPDRRWLVLAHRRNIPSIADMAQPMLRIGGRRINPLTNGRFRPSLITGFSVMRVEDGSERALELPFESGWSSPVFSPKGTLFFVTRDTDQGIELWVGDVEAVSAHRLLGPVLNGARGAPCRWMPGGDELLCHLVPADRGPPPASPRVPAGPVTQETSGVRATVRTYQDLLKDAHDVALYDYYMTSQPTRVRVADGTTEPIGPAGIYAALEASPDGRYYLAERRVKPYSYLVPDRLFPMEVEVWDAAGDVVAHLASVPLRDNIPIGGVETGPRGYTWLSGDEHGVLYVEALDGGDPRAHVERRDRVMLLDAPFTGEARELARTAFRYAGLVRGRGSLALLTEYDRPSRTRRTWKVDLESGGAEVLFEGNAEDRYHDPGRPVMEIDERGDPVMAQDGSWIFLTGPGGSDSGDRPFLDRLNLENGRKKRLWRAALRTYEVLIGLLDEHGRKLLTRYETPRDPPNYFVRDTRGGKGMRLTDFLNPHPQLSGVEKRFVTYERDDGVHLSATLYLPPGYHPGDRLPAVVWAYPREYSNAAVAGQVRGSPYRFTRISGYSHLFFLTQGYAVFDGAAMPIVGGDTANNTYVEQLVADAKAAVDKLDELGVADRDRIGIGGHSYGAFMTANLLAHSDLFAAGIARSGAYNRTLTPFGFQNERRTFWEAPEIYFAMSPFMHADSINEPMLMIHGMADNNSGTFPIQSERMYHALKGLGGTARLVMLPDEAHGYRARESVMDVLAEMFDWFDRYVKHRPERKITF